MTLFSVAVIVLGMPAALLLPRMMPKVTGAASHNVDMDQASAMSFEAWTFLPERAHPKRLALFA